MDRYTAIEYAKQRMKEIGKRIGQYHIRPLIVAGSYDERAAKKITLNAHNQYLYLVHYWRYFGLEIFSDTGYFNADDYTNNTIQEFTGQIQIQQLPSTLWSIENVDVKPIKQYPLNFITVIF